MYLFSATNTAEPSINYEFENEQNNYRALDILIHNRGDTFETTFHG